VCRVGTIGNVNEILDGHVVLDLECLDRIYLNAYVPTLQVGGQVATFFNLQRNQPIASPSLFQQMGEAFRHEVGASPSVTRSRWSTSAKTTARST
jgi:hypothetical protein